MLDEDILSELTEKIQLHLSFQEAKGILEKRAQFVKLNFYLNAEFECPNHILCSLKIGKEISAKAMDLWQCENIKFEISEEPFVFHINNLATNPDHPDYSEVARVNSVAKMPMQINFRIKFLKNCSTDNGLVIALVCPAIVSELQDLDLCTHQSLHPIFPLKPALPVVIPEPVTPPEPNRNNLESLVKKQKDEIIRK